MIYRINVRIMANQLDTWEEWNNAKINSSLTLGINSKRDRLSQFVGILLRWSKIRDSGNIFKLNNEKTIKGSLIVEERHLNKVNVAIQRAAAVDLSPKCIVLSI